MCPGRELSPRLETFDSRVAALIRGLPAAHVSSAEEQLACMDLVVEMNSLGALQDMTGARKKSRNFSW